MNDAPTAPVESAPPPRETSPRAVSAKPSRTAALLHIIGQLIEAGLERIATIRSQPDPEEIRTIGIAFGTFNLTLIVSRILRGLRIAVALRDWVTANAPRIDAPPPVRIASPRPSSPHRKPKPSEAEGNAALLDRVPTDREIAEMLRHRPIGAVLVDICADLGIGIDHPLWHEVKSFVIVHGGQELRVLKRTFQRVNDAWQEVETGVAPGWRFYLEQQQIADTTGPPPLSLAA